MKYKFLKLILVSIASLLLVMSCNKKDTAPELENPFNSFEYSGVFKGSLTFGGSSSSIEGYLTIDSKGVIILDLLSGRMTGTVLKTGTSYIISITESTGIFRDVIKINGTINISSRVLNLSCESPDGSPVVVSGTTPKILTNGVSETLKKSSVYFTHNESCKATITVNGITLSGLNAHYEGGLCTPTYSSWLKIHVNVDNEQSKLFCNNYKLKGLNGQSISLSDCSTAGFVLSKNTTYTYTVKWENGKTGSGSFTSPDGGGNMAICISNDGPKCNRSIIGKWRSSDGTGIEFSETKAIFYSFNSGWQNAASKGLVSVGSTKVRNVSQISATKWNCQVLFWQSVSGQVSVHWANDGIITMNDSGNSIKIEGTLNSGKASATYVRVL